MLRGLQEGGGAPKVVVRFRIIRKRDSIFFLPRLDSEVRPLTCYLTRVRKMAELMGSDAVNKSST